MNSADSISVQDLAKLIDHSLLHPTMTDAEIRRGCELAKRYQVATACVKPYSVPMAAQILAGSGVGVCSVIGFPHGNNHTAIKVQETLLAMKDGASEIDMVINIGKALGGAWDYVSSEIDEINQACLSGGALLKVIFENDYLNAAQITKLCQISSDRKVAFVKTSTGYGFVRQKDGSYNYRGATEEHLKLMREKSAPTVCVKAAGGLRTLDDCLRAYTLGVSRIGASATEAILSDAQTRCVSGRLPLAEARQTPLAGSGNY